MTASRNGDIGTTGSLWCGWGAGPKAWAGRGGADPGGVVGNNGRWCALQRCVPPSCPGPAQVGKQGRCILKNAYPAIGVRTSVEDASPSAAGSFAVAPLAATATPLALTPDYPPIRSLLPCPGVRRWCTSEAFCSNSGGKSAVRRREALPLVRPLVHVDEEFSPQTSKKISINLNKKTPCDVSSPTFTD